MMNGNDSPPNFSSNPYPEIYEDLANDINTTTTVKEVCNESQSIHDQVQPIVKEIPDGEPAFLQIINRKRKRNVSIFNIQNLEDIRSSQVEPISASMVTVLKYQNGEFVEVQSSSPSYNSPMSLRDMRNAITASLECCISQANIELVNKREKRDWSMNVEQNYSVQQVPTQVNNEKPEAAKKSPPASKLLPKVRQLSVSAAPLKKTKSPNKESIKFANRQKELMKLKKEMRKKAKLETNDGIACDLMNIAGHVWCRTVGVMCTMCGKHVQKSYGCFRRDNAPAKLMYLFTPGMNRIKICRRCLPYKKPAGNGEDVGKKAAKKPWVKSPGGNDAQKTHVIIKHKLPTKIEPRDISHDKPVSTATIDAIHRKITAANEPPDARFKTSPKIVLGESGKGQAMEYIKKLAENLKANYNKEANPTMSVQTPLPQQHVTSLTPVTPSSTNIIPTNIATFPSSGNTKETGSNLMTTQWTPLVLKQGSPLVTSSNIIQASVRPSVPQETGSRLMSTASPNIQVSVRPSVSKETGSSLKSIPSPNNIQASVRASVPQETGSNLMLTPLPNLQATVKPSVPQKTGSNLMLTPLPNLQATVKPSVPQETGFNLMSTSSPNNIQAIVRPSVPQETGSNLMLTPSPNLQVTVRPSVPQGTGSSLMPTPQWTPLSLVVQRQLQHPLKIASLATIETATDVATSKPAQTFGKTNSNELQTIPAIVVSSKNAIPGSGAVLLQIQRVKLVRERVGESKEVKTKLKLDQDSVGGKSKRVRPIVCVSCKSNVVKSYRCINQSLSPPKLQHLFNNETEVQRICRKCLYNNGGAPPPREKDLIGGKSIEDNNECPGTPVDQVGQREEQCDISKVGGELGSIKEIPGTSRDIEDLSGTPKDIEDLSGTPRDIEDLSSTPKDSGDLSGTPMDIEDLSSTPRGIEESTINDPENIATLAHPSVEELTGTTRDTARISNIEDTPDIFRESMQTVASVGNHGDDVEYPVNASVDDSGSIVHEETIESGEIKPLEPVGGLGMSYETSQSEFLFGTDDVIGSVVSIETAGDNDGHRGLEEDNDGLEGADILGEGVVLDTGIKKDNEGTLEHDGQREGPFGDVLNEKNPEKTSDCLNESKMVIAEDVTDVPLLNQNSYEELGAMTNLEGLTYDYGVESWRPDEAVTVQMEMNDVKINDMVFSEGSEETLSCEEDVSEEKRESEIHLSKNKKNNEDESGGKSIAEEDKRKVDAENESSLPEAEGDQDDREDMGKEGKMDNERMMENEEKESNVEEINNGENMNAKGETHKEEKEGNKEKMNNEGKRENEEKMNSEGERGKEEITQSEGTGSNEEKMINEGKRGNEETMNSEVKGGKEEITQSEGTGSNEEKMINEGKRGNEETMNSEGKEEITQSEGTGSNEEKMINEGKRGNEETMNSEGKEEITQSEGTGSTEEKMINEGKRGNEETMNSEIKGGKEEITQSEGTGSNEEKMINEGKRGNEETMNSEGKEEITQSEGTGSNEEKMINEGKRGNEETMNSEGKEEITQSEGTGSTEEKMINEGKRGNEETMNSEIKGGKKEITQSEGTGSNEEKMINEGKRGNEETMNSEIKGGKEEIMQSEGTGSNEEKIKSKTPESSSTNETEKSESLKKVKATSKKSALIEDGVVKENDKRLRQRRAVASPRKSPAKNENKVEIEYKTRGALLKKQKEAESASEESQSVKRKNEEKKPAGRGRKKTKMEDDAESISSAKKPKQVNKKPKQQKTTSKPILPKEKQEKIEQQ